MTPLEEFRDTLPEALQSCAEDIRELQGQTCPATFIRCIEGLVITVTDLNERIVALEE